MSDRRAARRRAERAERNRREEALDLDPEWQAYVMHVRTELLPKIEGSAMTVSIVPRKPEEVDVKFAVELGLSIMLDKPIILVVDPTTLLPEHLRRVADEIIVGDPVKDPEMRDDLIAAMKRIERTLDE